MSFLESLSSDRPLRSILVSNLPLEVSEEHVKELLAEFGLVLNTRVFKDESSLHILCEYGNQEMARRAIRTLNNFDMKGQVIIADIAGSEKSKAILQALQETSSGAQGEDAPTEKAPEEISKAVASLPAEQMFELMKQMKMCIENNPQEARNLLLQNPQLAYALLQAQVIMRIVDPEVAMKILNRPVNIAPVGEPETSNAESTQMDTASTSNAPVGDQDMRQLPPVDQDFRIPPTAVPEDKDMRQLTGDTDLRMMSGGMPDVRPPFDPRFRPGDPRVDPRAAQLRANNPTLPPQIDPRMGPADPRMLPGLDPRSVPPVTDPRMVPSVSDPRAAHGVDPRSVQGPSSVFGLRPVDPRSMQQAVDPRKMPMQQAGMSMAGMPMQQAGMPMAGMPMQQAGMPMQQAGMPPTRMPPPNLRMPGPSAPTTVGGVPNVRQPVMATGGKLPEDEEKAALIMQVLQLSDEQIAMLPEEQRRSIIVLKEQIARSQFAM